MRKVALLIDGGYLRELARTASKPVNDPNYIEKIALACTEATEELHRALYYDCPEFTGQKKLPVSGAMRSFTGNDAWLKRLGQKNLFAIRKGELKFRGWEPKTVPVGQQPTDADFKPRWEQKGVDMRIGLDIATMSHNRSVERIALLTGDTDFIPAMKYARTAGLQIISIEMTGSNNLVGAFLEHVDIRRTIAWPP